MKRFVDIASWPAPVVGPPEVAAMLGITPSRVNHLAVADPTFPRPVMIHAGSRRWYRSGIELWASLHRPQRERAHGPFGPEAGALLGIAERTAHDLKHSGVGDDHFWVALVDPAAPGVVRDVLESMGVNRQELLEPFTCSWPPGDGQGYAPGLRMSPAVQRQVARAADQLADLGGGAGGVAAIALALLADWPTRSADPFRRGGCAITSWLSRRGLDPVELRDRIVRCSRAPDLVADLPQRGLPKRRPARFRRSRQLGDLAPNPLGHDPWERHPWGSIFARRATGKSWIEEGRQYFFFYDRDRYRIKTASGRPVGYWWEIEPRPVPGRFPKGSKEAVVLPAPGLDVEWPERLAAFDREDLLVRRRRC